MRKPRKSNENVKMEILNTLFEIEYTHTYAFGIKENKMIKCAIVENAEEILPLITISERQATKKNSVWGVRMHGTVADFQIIKEHAREIFEVCSVEEMEKEYTEHGNRGSNNRGHIFERLCAEVMGGTQANNMTAKCIDTGDIIVNGEHIQCKFYNATVTTEPTMNNLYREYMERVA